MPLVVVNEKRQLEPHTVALVACAAVLVFFGRVLPAVRGEQRRNACVVLQPDGDVDVGVLARDLAGIEVDGPPAEQPVIDAVRGQRLVDAAKRTQLPVNRRSRRSGALRPASRSLASVST